MKIAKPAFLLLFIAFVTLSSCTDKSKLLLKTWKVENLKYTETVPEEMQQQIDRSVAEIRNSFRLTYNADGTYTTESSGQVMKGTWKLNWNSTSITSRSDKGDTKDFKIMDLTEDKFTFKAMEGKSEVIFEMVPAK
jgi:hypothetical protein